MPTSKFIVPLYHRSGLSAYEINEGIEEDDVVQCFEYYGKEWERIKRNFYSQGFEPLYKAPPFQVTIDLILRNLANENYIIVEGERIRRDIEGDHYQLKTMINQDHELLSWKPYVEISSLPPPHLVYFKVPAVLSVKTVRKMYPEKKFNVDPELEAWGLDSKDYYLFMDENCEEISLRTPYNGGYIIQIGGLAPEEVYESNSSKVAGLGFQEYMRMAKILSDIRTMRKDP